MAGFGEVIRMIGEFGAFQKCLVLLLCTPSFLTPFHMFGQIFISLDEPHHCNAQWIRAISPNITFEQELSLTIPKRSDGSLAECFRFTPFDLTCDRRCLNNISQTIFLGGLLTGSLIFGSLSDRVGSQMSILVALFIMGFFCTVVSLVPHLSVYIALRFIVGTALAGISIGVTVLSSQWVGPSYRPQALIIIHCANALGQMTLAGVAYLVRDWRLFQIITSAPAFLIFLYAWVLPNSARWLVTKRRINEARDVIIRGANTNRRTVHEDVLNQLAPEETVPRRSNLDLFRKSHLRNMTLILAWMWFVDSLVYCEVSFHIGDFGLNIYLTQLVFGAVEIPSRILSIFLLQCIGRKTCQCYWLILGGISCVIICVTPKEFPLIITVLAVIGKSAMAASLSTTYLFSAEIFPTVFRQFGLGVCSTSARVAGILAPLLGMLSVYHMAIPMFLCGSASLVAGILCCFLPETRNTGLRDGPTDPEAPPTREIAVIYSISCQLEATAEGEEVPDEGAIGRSYV